MYKVTLKTVDNKIKEKYLFTKTENKDLYIATLSVVQTIWDIKIRERSWNIWTDALPKWKRQFLANTIIAVVNTDLEVIDYITVPNYLKEVEKDILISLSEPEIANYILQFAYVYKIPDDNILTEHDNIDELLPIEDESVQQFVDNNWIIRFETVNIYLYMFINGVVPKYIDKEYINIFIPEDVINIDVDKLKEWTKYRTEYAIWIWNWLEMSYYVLFDLIKIKNTLELNMSLSFPKNNNNDYPTQFFILDKIKNHYVLENNENQLWNEILIDDILKDEINKYLKLIIKSNKNIFNKKIIKLWNNMLEDMSISDLKKYLINKSKTNDK